MHKLHYRRKLKLKYFKYLFEVIFVIPIKQPLDIYSIVLQLYSNDLKYKVAAELPSNFLGLLFKITLRTGQTALRTGQTALRTRQCLGLQATYKTKVKSNDLMNIIILQWC